MRCSFSRQAGGRIATATAIGGRMEVVVGHKRARVREPAHAPAAGCGGEEEDLHQPEAKRLLLHAPQHHPHPASRIYRVSRASGGKDRHSKVYTAKGIRDRRVRLSVATAIQFYDLQDRLGLDQPSKAIEWLIKAASRAIDALPELPDSAAFPSHPASAKPHAAADANDAKAKSACSTTSDTSKGSVLSLSRSDSRFKARERARHRIKDNLHKDNLDKDKDKDNDSSQAAAAAAASFTQLLTGMAAAPAVAADHKQQQQSWQPMTADYIGFAQPRKAADYFGFAQPRKAADYIGFAQSRKAAALHAMAPHAFASPAPHLGNHTTPIAMAPAHHFSLTPAAAEQPHAEMTTHFSFLQQDHFIHAAPPPPDSSPAAVDYNLSFSMSSGLVGVNNTRGTLQSNSHLSGHHHQLQRLDAPSLPFLFTPAAAAAAAPENHFAAAAALQLWDGFRHAAADMKEKGKH